MMGHQIKLVQKLAFYFGFGTLVGFFAWFRETAFGYGSYAPLQYLIFLMSATYFLFLHVFFVGELVYRAPGLRLTDSPRLTRRIAKIGLVVVGIALGIIDYPWLGLLM